MSEETKRLLLRANCKACGGTFGIVKRVGLQDTVRCSLCQTFQYNAPRTETGERKVSLSTVHAGITSKTRSRIIERASGKCETCGARELLTVGHLLSVKDATVYGYTDLVNHDENLISQCAECNAGQGSRTLPLRLAVAIMRARVSFARQEAE